MAGLLDWLSKQKDSAMNDYSGLMNNYPNAQNFGNGLINNISQHIPSNEDFQSPQKMGEWSQAAALNAPMGLMFTGPKSASWNHDAAATASKLLDNGADPAQVWKDHLIGRMPDKSLFSEIDDSGANLLNKDKLNDLSKNDPYGVYEAPIGEALNHQKLFSDYPQLNKTSVYYDSDSKDLYGASFNSADNQITLGAGLTGDQINSATLHELQHAIQSKEGWARGGSPESMKKDIRLSEYRAKAYGRDLQRYNEEADKARASGDTIEAERFSKLADEAMSELVKHHYESKQSPTDLYMSLTGEAQARATQDRMNLNMQQRRDTYPLAGDKLSDIPLNQLINRYR